MKTDGIRMVSILAVLLLLSTGMACVLTDDDSSAFSFPSNSASNPLTSFNYSAYSEIKYGTYTVYIAVGSSFILEGYYDDLEGSCSIISASGCEQYGLSIVGDDLRGTISKAGSLTVSVDNEGVGTLNGNNDTTLYFNFVDNTPTYYTHTIHYKSNGGSGSMSASSVTDTNSGYTSVQLKSNGFTRSGYHFTGWYVDGSYKSPGDYVSVRGDSSVTATAQWEQDVVYYTHTIYYNSNGGSGSTPSTTKTDTYSSSSLTLANNGFSKTGYHFTGWKINNTGTTYQPGQSVSVGTSVTAYAQWEQNTISLNAIDTQYAVVGKSVSFNASASSNPSGAPITFSKSNVPSGLSVNINGSTITCSSSTTGTFTFTLTASATTYQSDSRTVTVEFVPALAFTNSPLIGVIGS